MTEKIDRELIDNLSNCKIIANYAVGFNNINIKYAKSRGIIVTNTPDILTDATADFTMALILSCSRKNVESNDFVRKGNFK